MNNPMKKYHDEWTKMIIGIDEFVNKVEEDRTDNDHEGIGEEEIEELEYVLQLLQNAANEINDRNKFKIY